MLHYFPLRVLTNCVRQPALLLFRFLYCFPPMHSSSVKHISCFLLPNSEATLRQLVKNWIRMIFGLIMHGPIAYFLLWTLVLVFSLFPAFCTSRLLFWFFPVLSFRCFLQLFLKSLYLMFFTTLASPQRHPTNQEPFSFSSPIEFKLEHKHLSLS